MSTEIIIRSFATCGVTTSDPAEIHCIKEGTVPEAQTTIELQQHPALEDNGSESASTESGEETEIDEIDEVFLD